MRDPSEYFMRIALLTAEKSTCTRLSVGCVLTTPDHYLLSVGYNGTPKGDLHCKDLVRDLRGEPPCDCVHAEQNAIARCEASWRDEKRCYVTTFPCPMCMRLLAQINVTTILYLHDYRNMQRSMNMCHRLHINVVKMNPPT